MESSDQSPACGQLYHRYVKFPTLIKNLNSLLTYFAGKDYPERMVIHEEVSPRNLQWMEDFRKQLIDAKKTAPAHCHPSSDIEILNMLFSKLSDES